MTQTCSMDGYLELDIGDFGMSNYNLIYDQSFKKSTVNLELIWDNSQSLFCKAEHLVVGINWVSSNATVVYAIAYRKTWFPDRCKTTNKRGSLKF